VRKKNKGFGLRRQIEGELPANPRALIVEDLMTDGASKIHFASSLRAAKAKVSHVFVVFNYGIYTNTAQLLEEANLSLWALTDWRTTLEVAKRLNYFNKKQIAVVERFLSDAAGWSKAHNGASL
jgi:orotate phosphoribosyltransferase